MITDEIISFLAKAGDPISNLLLKHGMLYHPEEVRYQQGEKHHCFMNAGRLALGGKGIYVEGYIMLCGVPIHHAWVDVDDRAVDVTLPRRGVVTAYYGVRFRVEYLAKVILKTGEWGILCPSNGDYLAREIPDSAVFRDAP